MFILLIQILFRINGHYTPQSQNVHRGAEGCEGGRMLSNSTQNASLE